MTPTVIKHDLQEILRNHSWDLRKAIMAYVQTMPESDAPEEPKPKQRTPSQNRAIHLDCQLIADKLNGAGLDMRVVLKPAYSLPWTMESVKEHLFRPIMKALYGKESTRELEKGSGEIDRIHEVLMRELGEKHGISWHDFPSEEQQRAVQFEQADNLANADYPEYDPKKHEPVL